MTRFSKICLRTVSLARIHGEHTSPMAVSADEGGCSGDPVATVDSTIRLRNLETGAEETFVLTQPGSRRTPTNGLSVSFPLGRAALGKRVGDTFVYRSAGGPARIKIEALCGESEICLPVSP